jgi:hypothetical protein
LPSPNRSRVGAKLTKATIDLRRGGVAPRYLRHFGKYRSLLHSWSASWTGFPATSISSGQGNTLCREIKAADGFLPRVAWRTAASPLRTTAYQPPRHGGTRTSRERGTKNITPTLARLRWWPEAVGHAEGFCWLGPAPVDHGRLRGRVCPCRTEPHRISQENSQ